MNRNHIIQQLMWTFMQELTHFTVDEIRKSCEKLDEFKVSIIAIQRYINRLEKAGYIQLAAKRTRENRFPIYKMTKFFGIYAPLVSRSSEEIYNPNKQGVDSFNRMWVAMRILKRFSPQQISMCAEVELNAANKYISCLYQIGFVRCLQKGWRKQSLYCLVKDTGPIAPRFSRHINKVVDFNTKVLHEIQRVEVAHVG